MNVTLSADQPAGEAGLTQAWETALGWQRRTWR
jgi:hypothetical protein